VWSFADAGARGLSFVHHGCQSIKENHPMPLCKALRASRRTADDLEVQRTVAELALADGSFRAVFDDAPGPVAILAGRGEVDGRLLRVNAAFARMLGTTTADLQLRAIADITHPDDCELEAAVSGPEGARVVRKRYLHSAGRPVHVEVRLSDVRDADGALAYLVAHVVDLDAQEASRRALRDAARIRRDMVSTISHELRTPLTNVHGYLEMIVGEDFGALTTEQKRMLDIAMRNAVRLEEFVADLLMLARLDAAELDPIRHLPIDLLTVVRVAVGEVLAGSAERGQELLVDVPHLPVTVSADAAHLGRAVQSLVANAIKYTADGGRISVRVHADNDTARIEVADTGMGIRPEEIALLGHRFYRGSDAQRRAIGGTGLGLAITKTIVERHGGTLEIVSTPGKGSTFTIALPRRLDGRAAGTGGAGGAGGA
jgi:PAS domain S-box-containing protein